MRWLLWSLLISGTVNAERIALLGDSMGAGTFAGAEPASLALNEKHPFTQWLVRSLFNQPRYGFFSGDRVNSLAERLRIETRGEVYAKNYAVAGAVVLDALTEQLPLLVRDVSYHGRYQKIFVLIGANDLCSQTKGYSDHQEWLIAALSELSEKVYVIPLPPVHEVWRVKDKRGYLGVKASTVWKWTGICPRMTLDGERFFSANSRWRNQWNSTIKTHAQTYSAVYVGSMEHLKFDPSYVGRIDFFHPNRKANEAYAEAIWGHVDE